MFVLSGAQSADQTDTTPPDPLFGHTAGDYAPLFGDTNGDYATWDTRDWQLHAEGYTVLGLGWNRHCRDCPND